MMNSKAVQEAKGKFLDPYPKHIKGVFQKFQTIIFFIYLKKVEGYSLDTYLGVSYLYYYQMQV